MSAVGRRAVLGGIAAAAVGAAPARTQANADMRLRAALDTLAALPGYDARLRRLEGVEAPGLSPSARLDLQTIRSALAIDSQLERLIPGGRSEGPYSLPPVPVAGLWRRAHGDTAFALLLERHVGQRVDPEAAHRRFEREVAALGARADRLMRGAGLASGSVGRRYQALFADPRGLYPDDEADRDCAVAEMNRWLDHARRATPALTGPVPPASLDVSVRRMGRADEAAGKSGYRQLPGPGRSGVYFVDLRQIRRRPRWTLPGVVHHELLPGHMVQLPIEGEAGTHPLRIAYLPAFAEGWAIHAEQRMADGGAYRGAPLDELGHIHWLLFRAARGLVDTGIHHRRWTVGDARTALDLLQGEPAYFAPFAQDLDRIVAEPGLRAAEALTWFGLADRTRGLVGPALRRTHRAILANGRKPLRLLPNSGSMG